MVRPALLLLAYFCRCLIVTSSPATEHKFSRLNCYLNREYLLTANFNITAAASLVAKCTHVTLCFAAIEGGKVTIGDFAADKTAYERFRLIRGNGSSSGRSSSRLKLLIAIPGPDAGREGANKVSLIVKYSPSIDVFVSSVVKFLDEHSFDGILLDWRHPVVTDYGYRGRGTDLRGLSLLISELHGVLKPKNYVLAMTASAHYDIINFNLYEHEELEKYVDFFDLLTYNYTENQSNEAGHWAPLHAIGHSTYSGHNVSTVSWGVGEWTQKMSSSKLNIMLVAYGRLQNLLSTAHAEPQAPALGGATVAYKDFCARNYSEVWFSGWDAPVAIIGQDWISYDNERSLAIKINYAKTMKLGGAAFWAIDADDTGNFCGSGKSPLFKAVAREMGTLTGSSGKIATAPLCMVVTALTAMMCASFYA